MANDSITIFRQYGQEANFESLRSVINRNASSVWKHLPGEEGKLTTKSGVLSETRAVVQYHRLRIGQERDLFQTADGTLQAPAHRSGLGAFVVIIMLANLACPSLKYLL